MLSFRVPAFGVKTGPHCADIRCTQLQRPPTLQCEGINLAALHREQDVVDTRRLTTNDIHAVLNTYGLLIVVGNASAADAACRCSFLFRVSWLLCVGRCCSFEIDFSTYCVVFDVSE